MMKSSKYGFVVLLCLSVLVLVGCVERTIAIRTDPPGALVTVNEVEKGRTPLSFPFTWYGRYYVRVEHPEYQVLETTRNVPAPIYQWPVLDFISEIILPFKFHDEHNWSFTLLPRNPVDTDELIDRAEGFRQEAQIDE